MLKVTRLGVLIRNESFGDLLIFLQASVSLRDTVAAASPLHAIFLHIPGLSAKVTPISQAAAPASHAAAARQGTARYNSTRGTHR